MNKEMSPGQLYRLLFADPPMQETVTPGDQPGIWTHVFTPYRAGFTYPIYPATITFVHTAKSRKAMAREKYIARAQKRRRRQHRSAFRRQKRGLA